ncbi:MAG: DUF3551 domain-containing protein [Hyphomicrobiales bacterium]|nr:DUF3551 domain-containing protein [Hyphomicrobiales bacterium]
MRAILTATALLVAAGGLSSIGATSAEAREYPWCSRTSVSGFNPSCDFTSYAQCMATVSGQRGSCMRNPYVTFNEQREPRRKGRQMREQHNDWNNNGWNQRW